MSEEVWVSILKITEKTFIYLFFLLNSVDQLVTWYFPFETGIQYVLVRHPYCFPLHAGHSDGHVGVDLDLLYGALRAEVSNSTATSFGQFD